MIAAQQTPRAIVDNKKPGWRINLRSSGDCSGRQLVGGDLEFHAAKVLAVDRQRHRFCEGLGFALKPFFGRHRFLIKSVVTLRNPNSQ